MKETYQQFRQRYRVAEAEIRKLPIEQQTDAETRRAILKKHKVL